LASPYTERNICDIENDTWYHIRIDFETSANGYLGIPQHKHRIYVNQVYQGEYDNYTEKVGVYRTTMSSYPVTGTPIVYYDAIDYSWDTDYEIHRNTVRAEYEEVIDVMSYTIDRNLDMVSTANFVLYNPRGDLNNTWKDRIFNQIYIYGRTCYGEYGFQHDTIGQTPSNWTTNMTVVGSHAGRYKLLKMVPVNSASKTIAAQTNGTVEYSIYPTANCNLNLLIGDSTNVVLYLKNGTFWHYDSGDLIDSKIPYKEDEWLHLKIDFECGAGGYKGLSADTFQVYYRSESEKAWKCIYPIDFNNAADSLDYFYLYAATGSSDIYFASVDVSWGSNYHENNCFYPIPLFQGRIKNIEVQKNRLSVDCEGLLSSLSDQELEDVSFIQDKVEIEDVTDANWLECKIIGTDPAVSPEWTNDEWIGKGISIEDKTTTDDITVSQKAGTGYYKTINGDDFTPDVEQGDYTDSWDNDANFWDVVWVAEFNMFLEFTITPATTPTKIVIPYIIYCTSWGRWRFDPKLYVYNYHDSCWDYVEHIEADDKSLHFEEITTNPTYYMSNAGAGNDTIKIKINSGQTELWFYASKSSITLYYMRVDIYETYPAVPRVYVITDNTDNDLQQTAHSFTDDYVEAGDYVRIISRNDKIIDSLVTGFGNKDIKTSTNYSGMKVYGLTPLDVVKKLSKVDGFNFWVDYFGAFHYTDDFSGTTHTLTDSDVLDAEKVKIIYSKEEFYNQAKVYGYENIESDWYRDDTSASTYGIVRSKILKDDTITSKIEGNALAESFVNRHKDINPSCVIAVLNRPEIDIGHTITLTLRHLTTEDFTVEGITYSKRKGKDTQLYMILRLGNQPTNLPTEKRIGLYIKELDEKIKTRLSGVMSG